MWYLHKIPRIANFYWGGGKMSKLRYMTITSFMKYNPEWEVRYYYPKVSTIGHSWTTGEMKYEENWRDYTHQVMKLPIRKIEVDFGVKDFTRDMSEVHRSDYLRWCLLAGDGGAWIDMDILFFRSMDDLEVNNPNNADVETVVSISSYGHSIGFMMASEHNATFGKMRDHSIPAYVSHKYQCIGSLLFNKLFPTITSIPNSVNLGMEAVYFYDANHTKEIFGMSTSPLDNPKSIGIHWYAGSDVAGEYLNKTNGGEENLPDCTLSRIITH